MNRTSVDCFKSDPTRVGDEPRSGRPAEVFGSSLESETNGLISDSRRITVEMINKRVQVSVGTVQDNQLSRADSVLLAKSVILQPSYGLTSSLVQSIHCRSKR